MERKERAQKRSRIGEKIDLSNGRFSDDEINQLYDIVNNPQKYDGKTKTHHDKYTSFSSDGKFTRTSQDKYTLKAGADDVQIEESYSYHDDDGQSGTQETVYKKGRDILNILKKYL